MRSWGSDAVQLCDGSREAPLRHVVKKVPGLLMVNNFSGIFSFFSLESSAPLKAVGQSILFCAMD